MENYARTRLLSAESYNYALPNLYHRFIAIPHALAIATLDARNQGKQKLSRADVIKIVTATEQVP